MHSTSTSNRDIILSVEKLNLVFNVDLHRSWTLRDVFTRAATNPLSLMVKNSDRLRVAHDISFEIKNGDRVGLLGVNGAGKTSLCRCIAGMYKPTTGRVHLRGSVRAIFNAQVGIQPELTGHENAELLVPFLFPEATLEEAKNIVEEALTFSELGAFLDVPYRIYSTGMQLRLFLSLISTRPADLLILDEVFDGADAFFREKISKRITDLIEKSGAVIFVSHSSEHVKRVCNRVLVLDKAQIAFDGLPEAALEFYASTR